MADIRVDTNKLRSQAQRLANIKRRLDSLKGRMSSFDNSYSDRLETYTLQKCILYLNGVADEFERTEQYVQKFDPKKFSPIQVIADQLMPSVSLLPHACIGDFLINSSPFSKIVKSACGVASGAILTLLGEPLKGGKTTAIEKSIIKQTKKEKNLANPGKWDKEIGTVLEKKKSVKVSGELVGAKVSGESKYAKGSAHVGVLDSEAHAEYSAGLYAYDKNGKKIFSPAVKAEVGASTAILHVDAEGRVGLGKNKDMLGAYGKGDVKVAAAEGKASVSIKKGELHGKLSAEADLVKATGSAGVTVLGTDIGVKGSVKVGVGAHIDVGFKDGKFKADIGAALGVGFDLGIEIDVKGTVDAVCGAAKSAWDGFTGFVGGLFGKKK